MAESRPIRLLLADDHIVVRTGLVSIIQSRPDMTVVAEAVSGAQAIELFRQHRPDLVLMDLRMPGLDGVEAMKAIRAEFRDARFLVLTMYRRDEDIYRAFCAGALGYVLKSAGSEELVGAIRAVAQGRRHIPAALAAQISERLPLLEISTRELDVLRLICKGMVNRDIAGRLGIAENTVKNHVAAILDKLGAQDRTQAAVYALERGIVNLETMD
jgi:two-component system, NarL family, response regulator